MTKYCRDCRFIETTAGEEALCAKGALNLVTGDLDRAEALAREMRYRGACGPEGKLFEPKTPEAA